MDQAGRARDRRRGRRVVLLSLALLVAVVGAATARLFLRPGTDTPRQVDAVVLFVGGRGERLALAKRLMAAGVAERLVIPNGLTFEWPEGNAMCREPQPYEVLCPDPSPDTTRGEARTIGALAEQHGWDEVLLVTTRYHVTRARVLLERCYDGRILAAAATPRDSPVVLTRRIAHEWAGWTAAQTVARDC